MAEDKNSTKTNADFRKLLLTPRPTAAKESSNLKKQKQQQQKKPRPPPSLQPRKTPKDEDQDASGIRYRDRAAERRRGIPTSGDPLNEPLSLSVEESKYLGGDIEHTHLVKGLDYALLNRLKTSKEDDSLPALDKEAQQPPTFATPLGRSIYNFITTQEREPPKTQRPSERFLPRRTAYIYRLDSHPEDPPTTVERAKEDCPPPPKTLSGNVDAPVLERLSKIMAYISVGDGKKLNKKKKVSPPPLPPSQPAELDIKLTQAPVDEDEDIFADAGTDYVAERRSKDNEEAKLKEGQKRTYFSTSVLEEEEEKEKSRQLPAAKVIDEEEKRRRESRRQRMLAEINGEIAADEYEEYEGGDGYDSEDQKPDAEEAAEGQKGKPAASKLEAMKEKNKMEAELLRIQKVFEEKGFKNEAAFGAVAKKREAMQGEEPQFNSEAAVASLPTKKKRRI